MDQMNVPAYSQDHAMFKIMATNRGLSMKDLFHKIIEHEATNGERKIFKEIGVVK